MVDLLANFPRTKELELSQAKIMVIEEEVWQMYFDCSSIVKGSGAGVVLMSPSKEHVLAYKLDFLCSNNKAKYKALLVGLRAAKELGVKKLQVFRHSKLVIRQSDDSYRVKALIWQCIEP